MELRKRDPIKRWSACMGAIVLILSLIPSGLSVGALADESNKQVAGKVYTFPGSSHYEISDTHEYQMSDAGGVTYGTFEIRGTIEKSDLKDGIPSYQVNNGNLELSYTYDDSLLKAEAPAVQLCSDSDKKIDGRKLGHDIEHGVIILQTSMDRKNWVDLFYQTNLFEDTPIQEEPFYVTKDIELLNGCYYRVIIAYETRIKTGTSTFLFVTRNNYEYTKHAEVYEFYAYSGQSAQQPDAGAKTQLGERVRVENFDGYYGDAGSLSEDDPHYGWDLGQFFVSGHAISKTDEGTPMFLKKEGDQLLLWFHLEQDLNSLNGNSDLSISADRKGSDNYFEVGPIDMGRGTLIIQHTDHENIKQDPQIYTNYLEANTTMGADTKVSLFEEGDYEVALDYEIKKDRLIDKYSHYRIFFRFSVRNSNSMAFLFDINDGHELKNGSITENGFRLDLAQSHYLNVFIKKEVLEDGADGLTEDVRFNHVATDGQEYTEEGIYTITVKNRYTEQETEKRIYVGANRLLKAHMQTGSSISELKNLVAEGATIDEDGTISIPVAETSPQDLGEPVPVTVPQMETEETTTAASIDPESAEVGGADIAENGTVSHGNRTVIWILIIVLLIVSLCITYFLRNKNHWRQDR